MALQCLLGLDLQRRVERQLHVVALGRAVKQFLPRGLPIAAVGLPAQFWIKGRFDSPGPVAQAGVAKRRRGLWHRVAPGDDAIVRYLYVGQHDPISIQDAPPHDALFVEHAARIVVAGAQRLGADDGPVAARRGQEGEGDRKGGGQVEEGCGGVGMCG